MAAFEETIVRTFFEQHGFLVRRLDAESERRSAVPAAVFLIMNPALREDVPFHSPLLFSGDLTRIRQSLVVVREWHHAGKISPRTFQRSGDLYQFLERTLLKKKEALFPQLPADVPPGIRRLLVLPAHVTQEPHKGKLVEQLGELGVDGVFSFRSMFRDLANMAMDRKKRSSDEVLDLVRLLAEYDLIKGEEQYLGF